MPRIRGRAAGVVLLMVGTLIGAAAAQAQPIQTGIYLRSADESLTDPAVAAHVAAAGVSFVRLSVSWADVAPSTLPASWDPTDPGDSHYDWSSVDTQIGTAVAQGLQPLASVLVAPSWAQHGKAVAPPASYLPDPAAFGQFAQALARRYSGSFEGLPRVRYFQAWNEPNLSLYLVPQLTNGVPVGANDYRLMLNAFASAVHGVRADDVVVAGGLAPFRDVTPSVTAQDKDWGPLSFMRAVLCLSTSLKPTCRATTHADVWAMHPYTSGNATHHAVLPNDVSLGDLGKVQHVLRAARATRHLMPSHPLQLWVTEFSWDSRPPDPKAVPLSLLRRWVPEALHEMWRNGVSVAIWFQLRDDPIQSSFYQSGLYFRGSSFAADRPKPFLEGFRFPFVAYAHGARISVWGRLPGSRPGTVLVQQAAGRAWLRLATLHSDSAGIVRGTVRNRTGGSLRGRVAGSGETSLPFSLTVPPDMFVNPFGLPTLLEPKKGKP